jgi:hypothetical protein
LHLFTRDAIGPHDPGGTNFSDFQFFRFAKTRSVCPLSDGRNDEQVHGGDTAREIINRISEINFNASLTAEIKMIDLLAQMIDQGHLKPGPDFRPVNLHRIVLDGGPQVTSASQLNNDYEFFKMLHRAGQCAAQQFLESHFDDIGVRGTLAAEQAAA